MPVVEGTLTSLTVVVSSPAGGETAPTVGVDDGIGVLGEELYQQILPLHGPDPDGLAYDLVGAWILGTQRVYELVGDTGGRPGWGALFDPDALFGDELKWLAQARGVRLRAVRSGEAMWQWERYARTAIRLQAAQYRGTVEAQIDAVRATLTGTKWVAYTERVGGDAYAIAVRTKTVETPDPAATLAAMVDYEYGQKPAGLVLDYATVSGQTYGAIAGLYASYAALAASAASYRALAEAQP
jgi:hypothetical protein